MCGLLLMAAGTFIGIMACVYAVSEMYSSGGIFGILALIGCVILAFWIADQDLKKKKDDEDKHKDN